MGGFKEKTKSIWQLLRTQWSTVRKRLTLISQMKRHTDTWRRSHDLFESILVSAPDALPPIPHTFSVREATRRYRIYGNVAYHKSTSQKAQTKTWG